MSESAFEFYHTLKNNIREIIAAAGRRLCRAGTANVPAKFELRAPHPQNEIDIFCGMWASDIADIVPGVHSGTVGHFTSDPRPAYAMKTFAGRPSGRKLHVLELGPLEGGHTYQFEKMGVDEIVSVEANVQAFLKCLIVKNLAGLRARFLLGDFVEYLKEDKSRYDFIFCCGVLYHMEDPLQLIERMSTRTDRVFVWTHYYTAESRPVSKKVEITRGGEKYFYYSFDYSDRFQGRFWGGNKPTASFLSRGDIMRAFAQYGFVNHELHEEDLAHPGGPCFAISFWR